MSGAEGQIAARMDTLVEAVSAEIGRLMEMYAALERRVRQLEACAGQGEEEIHWLGT